LGTFKSDFSHCLELYTSCPKIVNRSKRYPHEICPLFDPKISQHSCPQALIPCRFFEVLKGCQHRYVFDLLLGTKIKGFQVVLSHCHRTIILLSKTTNSRLFLTGCYMTVYCPSSSNNQSCHSYCLKAANMSNILPSEISP
jgi:hypothetical protein